MKILQNEYVRTAIDAVLYLVIFVLLQAVILNLAIYAGGYAGLEQGVSMAVGIVLSGICTIWLFAWRGWSPYSRRYISHRPWLALVWVALLSLGSVLPSEWMLEAMNVEVPEETAKLMELMMQTPWGYMAIGVLAPMAEEMVFRGAILRKLLKVVDNKWLAIFISALVFGAIHGNLPQFIHATLIGILLGWMYAKTGSIVPGVVFHWINNTVAFVLYHILPQADGKIIDLFGGDTHRVYMALAFSMCIFVPSLIQTAMRLKK